eukprot:m.294764 g.294764  ORF g.294764 m.294764 type:complete len:689 (-) comp15850_c0_seq12:2623-4689(-)
MEFASNFIDLSSYAPEEGSQQGTGAASLYDNVQLEQAQGQRQADTTHNGIRVDTNICQVTPARLIKSAQYMSIKGAVTQCCSYCKGLLNPFSKTEKKTWTCCFCGTKNAFKSSKLTKALLSNATAECKLAQHKKLSSCVIFCVDVSGSMGVTQAVEKGTTIEHVSRLDFIRSAINQYLAEHTCKDSSLAVVCFSDKVQVLTGTGSTVIPETEMYDEERLLKLGKSITMKPATKTKATLQDQLKLMAASGQTALGPAMLLALGMCSNFQESQIILCTDGVANIGLGAMSPNATQEDHKHAATLYRSLGIRASMQATRVHVVTIKGEECQLQHIGRVAERSGGEIVRAAPEELQDCFHKAISSVPIASNVSINFIAPSSLQMVFSGVYISLPPQHFTHTEVVGCVSESTEAMFQVAPVLGPQASIAAIPVLPEATIFPFQVQLWYTLPNGATMFRSKTIEIKTTRLTADAEYTADPGIIAGFATHAAAMLIQSNMGDAAAKVSDKCNQLIVRIGQSQTVQQVDYEAAALEMQDVYGNLHILEKGVVTDEDAERLFGMKRNRSVSRRTMRQTAGLRGLTVPQAPIRSDAQQSLFGGDDPDYENPNTIGAVYTEALHLDPIEPEESLSTISAPVAYEVANTGASDFDAYAPMIPATSPEYDVVKVSPAYDVAVPAKEPMYDTAVSAPPTGSS